MHEDVIFLIGVVGYQVRFVSSGTGSVASDEKARNHPLALNEGSPLIGAPGSPLLLMFSRLVVPACRSHMEMSPPFLLPPVKFENDWNAT